MEKKPSVNEKLDQCIGTLEEIRNSGYWPLASPAPCSTESKIKESINEALRQLRIAKANHELMWTDLNTIAGELGIPKKASVETMRKARALWEQYDHESEWTPSETPGKQDVYLKVTENGERYFFEGEGKSDDGIQTIVSLTCRCPDGTIAKLF